MAHLVETGPLIHVEERALSRQKIWHVVILCSPLVVDWLCKTFTAQIADQQLPATIIWSGASYRYGQGMVVMAWWKKPSDHFVEQLEIDSEVIDYVLYKVPMSENKSNVMASSGI